MKKFLALFVVAFSLMSFSNTDYNTVVSNEDITYSSDILNDYQISVDYSYLEEIDCWKCSATIVNPDFSTTTISATSCISPSMACFYVGRELTRLME